MTDDTAILDTGVDPDHPVHTEQGSSMATPFVAGAITFFKGSTGCGEQGQR